jgi:putative NADH-flavin reductase
MRIIVFGANGPTGRRLIAAALAEGNVVTAYTRKPRDFPISHRRLRVAAGDVLDAEVVAAAVRGQDAVLSTLGAPFSRHPVSVYSQGGEAVLAAMKRHGVQRFVCVTSSVMEREARTGGPLFDRVVQPLVVNTLGRTVYADMRRLEDLVTGSDVAWTIVRPSGLFETEHVTSYAVGERHLPHKFTSRADLADCLLRQATDASWAGRILAVATTDVSPSLMTLIWREGIRKRS